MSILNQIIRFDLLSIITTNHLIINLIFSSPRWDVFQKGWDNPTLGWDCVELLRPKRLYLTDMLLWQAMPEERKKIKIVHW